MAENDNQPLRTLVVGLGATGLSVARHLKRQGIPVAIVDSRAEPPGLAQLQQEHKDVAAFLGGFDDALFEQADMLVVSPGVPLSTPQIARASTRGVPVIGDIELFARAVRAPVVAITGSNGKSTVTTLVGEMVKAAGLRAAVGGNLGTPALDLLDDRTELYVLELSSFQLESTRSLYPAVACVLNLSPDHMDRYPDLAAYAAAKARVLEGAETRVCNADDPVVMAMPGAGNAVTFTLGEPCDEEQFGVREQAGRTWLCQGTTPLIAADEVLIPGLHNRANALAALAIGSVLNLPPEVMTEVLRRFPGLPHRCEFVGEVNGVRWYNDSKATNVGAALAALKGLEQGDDSRAVMILGGDCKEGDFGEMREALARHARGVVLMGRDREQIRPAIPESCQVADAGDLEEAVGLALEMARPGDHVLLAPACASFDQFRDYAERGDRFRGLVRRLGA
ncbi:MAG: UDP-N-acetylmuramoyl-L-alanine--D-glutamate ligase [Gammaproteobacteria bacterium]|nr:MAG: UDP-N-acetylmuramoyl-L-alanine--D-glutamate ligase [Gammaproteobacteria bacterium]